MPRFRRPRRLAALVVLAASEMLLASAIFGFPNPYQDWSNPVFYANSMALLLMLSCLVFVLVAWTKREELAHIWVGSMQRDTGRARLLINLGLFAALMGARALLAEGGPQGAPAFWYWGYSALVVATGASLGLVLAPVAFWRELPRRMRPEIILALAGACLVLLIAALSRESWYALTIATFRLSYAILSLYEANPFIDVGQHTLGAEQFRVQIWAACSGYEGIGLVTAFLAIFMWVFRAHLRFPNAYCLIPIGIGAIWLLNGVRVALLISIGAHISPVIALEGFHSWSGWIAFIIVTAGIMVASRYSAFIWREPPGRAPTRDDEAARQVVICVAPFAAFMAARIFASAFAPFEQVFYPLTVVAIGMTLWWFRRDYAQFLQRVSWLSVVCGLAVGIAWIATDPQRSGADAALGGWLAGLPVAVAASWLILRAIGSVLLVPIAEELAFRGYLRQVVESFASRLRLTPAQVHIIALVVSSLAFGVLHERYVAGALAGAVYAALIYRTNRMSDPIAAHMTSNGAIVIWSIAAGQWTLL